MTVRYFVCDFCIKYIYIVMSCDKGGYLNFLWKIFKPPLLSESKQEQKATSCEERHERQDKDIIIMSTYCQ